MTIEILALDDEPTVLALYQSVLEPAGYHITTSADSWSALAILRTKNVDLLIQDFQRPEINGQEMLQLLKASPNLRRIPVLIITADSREELIVALKLNDLDWDTDIQGYLQKPFAAGELLDLVESVLQKYDKPLPPVEKRRGEREWWEKAG